MRESLTIFAIAIILALSALLVGPYLIDWSGQRDWLQAKLSHALGAQVRIAGPIDVKLLPRPIFQAGQVSIDGATPQDPRFSAERLDAELSINGLLQGTAEFVDARVTRPRVEVTMRQDGSIVAPSIGTSNPQRIQFNHLTIVDGSVAVLDETGKPRSSLSGVNADGEAETLFGPLKISGSAATGQGDVAFRLNTGALAGQKLRVHLAVDHKGGWTHADAEGMLSLGETAAGRRKALAFQGNLGLSGELRIADGASPVPWSISATGNDADLQNLAAPAIEVRAGADARALVATGSALFSLSGEPAGVAKLRARQLDLDHITVPPDVAPDTPRPSAAQWLAAIRSALDSASPLPMRLRLDLGVDAITSGDLTLTDAAATLDTRRGAPPHVTFTIAGPNASRLALDGAVDVGAAPAFEGHADVTTRDMAAVAGWLSPFWPKLQDALGPDARGRLFAAKGTVNVSPAGFVARDATMQVVGSSLNGTLSVTVGQQGERPHVSADLTADSIDSSQWPDLHQLVAETDPIDLDLTVRSDAVTLARTDVGGAITGRVALHATKRQNVFSLDQFDVSGFNGAQVSATGSLDADRRIHAEGRASAPEVAPVAAVLKALVPGAASDGLVARAASLSPLQFSFKADAVLDADAGLTPIGLSANGTAAGTRFTGTLSPELHGGSTSPVDAIVVLDGAEAAQVLAQAGWHTAGTLGSLHAEAHLQGSLADGFATKLAATLPDAELSFDGQVDAATGQGRLRAHGSDVDPLLHAAGLDVGPADRVWAAGADVSWSDDHVGLHQISGKVVGSAIAGDLDYARTVPVERAGMPQITGALTLDTASLGGLALLGLGSPQPVAGVPGQTWSASPFGMAPSWPAGDIALKVGRLDLWPGIPAHDANLTLQLRPNAMTLADMSAHVLGGSVGGTVTLRRIGPTASVTGQVSFDKLAVALPSLSGRLSGTLNLAGTGQSPAALIGSFAGDGSLSMTGATLPRLDPGALDRVAKLFNAEGATVDNAPVSDALAPALDRSSLALGDVAAPATVAAGVIRVPGIKASGPDAAVSSDAAFDLHDLTFELRTLMTANVLPKDWKGDPPQVTVTWRGPLGAPTREVDAGAFVNGLAARAIAREQDRIELMKDDLRERAFFARRLKQIEAEQQATRDAGLSPKIVPQPPPRPTDIRLPKPPDVGTPTLSPGSASGGQDGITRFLDTLPRSTERPASGANAPLGPIELTPASRATAAPSQAHAPKDPGVEGRY